MRILPGVLFVGIILTGQASVLAQAPKSAPINPRAAAPAQGMEADTNRFGSDYRGFDAPSAPLCQTACINDAMCKAWTWVKPGVQGPSGKCWLKNQVPPPTANACCVSGVHAQAQLKPAPQAQAKGKRPGVPAPVAAPIRVVNPMRRNMGQDRSVKLGQQNAIASSTYRGLLTEKGTEHMIETGVVVQEIVSINGQKPAGFVLRPGGAFVLRGHGFGKGGSMALIGNFRDRPPSLIVSDWRPTMIYARVRDDVRGEVDLSDVRLEIYPYSLPHHVTASGLRFEATWDEGSMPIKEVPRRFASLVDPQPAYGTSGQRPIDEMTRSANSYYYEGLHFVQNVPASSVIVARHAWGQGTSPFRPGTDTYTLPLKPGFAVAHVVLNPARSDTSPVECTGESGGTYFAGKYLARVEGDNVIKVDWGVWRCHVSGFLSPGYNEHLSGYGLDVYISGPLGVNPFQ